MGLGKTLQAIALLCYLKFERNISGPFLVLCPLSVIDGWSSEFRQHASKLRVLQYIGSKEERAVFSKGICDFVNSQSSISWEDPVLPFDVLLTTYDLAMIDVGFLSRFCWRYGIIDEAQRLKNFSAVLYRTLENNYMMPRRLLLTGTPIQNNLSELWALLHFCMPQVYNSLEDFLKAFPLTDTHVPIKEHDADVDVLKVILNVFMLRRTKSALVQSKSLELPSLAEVTIMAKLVPLQKQVYLSVLKRELPKVLKEHGILSRVSLQNIVVQLRKACSHPYLFDGVEPEPFEEGEHLIKASGKLMVLDSILENLYNEKHRVLIYAQMTRTLDILQDYLVFRGYLYERLDGSVRAEERFVAARKFCAKSIISEVKEGSVGEMPFVFLLTTRAGGIGLNLTAADTVIFFEQDWNPQADKQALQRAHRMGQINPVLAINLVTEDTIEEVILSGAKKKLKLTNDIIGDIKFDPNDDPLYEVKHSELQSMIVFGLDKLHSSTTEAFTEDEVMPQLEQLVKGALEQRNKIDSDDLINEKYVSDTELEENLYFFEGQDFTPKKRKDVEKTEIQEPASRALKSWIEKLGHVPSNQEITGRRGKKHSLDNASTAESAEEDRAAKQQKAELRKHQKWENLGYRSLAVQDPGEIAAHMQTQSDEAKVHFVFGDCTEPSLDTNESAVIFSVVDDSGIWGHGGMFSALNRLSSDIQEAYEAAHTAGDLHVGDLHLIPMHERCKNRFWIALGIAQSYDRRRKTPRSDISIQALDVCLRKATSSAAAISASIHMPRISSHAGQDSQEWYAIERILRKYASQSGVHVYVYYYKRSNNGD
ncbi:hypothetical protein KP509_06G004000 [Ceratopteris richardii]|uniref:Uncharacterized protein n=1 Tax=Ceratopteris richardii TaxID=49495 RepID=A0A8T2UFD0_CERRI|nr:hypothetical protein KP509_06G004000 [Ceratopteris richardii]KAH7434173.1 hypothetical protein KP509_06G004000 [Ceratopteris richardii]